MKNIERYFNLSKENVEQVLKMKPIKALIDCIYVDEIQTDTINNFRQWLMNDYVIEITKIEYHILKIAFINDYDYIARDANGNLYTYMNKPYKDENDGNWYDDRGEQMMTIDEDDLPIFSFVRREDKKPYDIEILLKEARVIE